MNLPDIHARMKAAAAVARLPLADAGRGGTAGNALGRQAGSSLDFHDHRLYVPGDDPRHLNWQAFARTGHYTLKLYREEVTPRIDLVYDLSGSMFLDPAKEGRVWELFYFCLESGLMLGGHVKLFLLCGRGVDPPVEVPLAGPLADDWPRMPARAARAATDTAAAPAALAEQIALVPLRPNSLRVLVSDLLDESPPARVAAGLIAGNGRGLVLAPFSRAESDPDWSGTIDFEDAERLTRRRQQVTGGLLDRYRAAYRRHFTLWREACASRGVGLAQVSDADDFLTAIRHEAVPAGAIVLEGA